MGPASSICSRILISQVGFEGNLSLLDIFDIFSRGLHQMEGVCDCTKSGLESYLPMDEETPVVARDAVGARAGIYAGATTAPVR